MVLRILFGYIEIEMIMIVLLCDIREQATESEMFIKSMRKNQRNITGSLDQIKRKNK